MNRNALAAALVAGLVLLAGCSGGLTGSPDGTVTDESALDGGTTAEAIQGETGTVNMYVSDEVNAIDDFEHLNVTITRVGVKPAGDDGDSEADDAEDESETDDANASVTTETEASDGEEADDTDDGEEADDTDDGEEADDTDDDGEWVEYEVDNRTIDLTELKGANATKLAELDVPNGTYQKVFVHVADVDGTLKDGSDQRVQLPSGKLQVNSEFTVGNGESVDFVFDITAIKAGNSGKYVLKPVISESGTDVEIDDVDERDDDEREDDERAADLTAAFDGDVVAGENATLRVTSDGEPVAGATVSVDGDRVGETDADGTHVIRVPNDAEEIEVAVTYRDAEAEVEVDLGDGPDDESEDDPDGTATANGTQQRLTVD